MKKVLVVLVLIGMITPMRGLADEKKADAKKAKAELEAMLVTADGNCPQPCVVIGKASRIKHSIIGDCSDKLKKYLKKEHGADAVLLYKIVPTGGGPLMCEGVAVRWAKEGEVGITKITDETPVPIIK